MELPIFIKAENQLINIKAIVSATMIPAVTPPLGIVPTELIIEFINGKTITLKGEYAEMAESVLDEYVNDRM